MLKKVVLVVIGPFSHILITSQLYMKFVSNSQGDLSKSVKQILSHLLREKI